MLTEQEMREKLKTAVNPRRYKHVLGVEETAVKMAERYGVDVDKARTAALLHDCAKDFDDGALLAMAENHNLPIDAVSRQAPQLLHGPAGAIVARAEYGVSDQEIFDAITYHTTGRPEMSALEKIIYLADYIEPGRNFPGIAPIRQAAMENLNRGVYLALTHTIAYVLQNDGLVDPLSVAARNELLVCCRDEVVVEEN